MINKSQMIFVISILFIAMFIIVCKRTENTGRKTRLTILDYADNTVANAAADRKWVFYDTFAVNNPDVQLEKEDLFNEPFHNKVEVYAASGNMPDVLYVWPSGRSTSLHEKRLLKDLAPLIERDSLKDKFLPITMDPKRQASGYLAMLPIGVTASHAFYINMEVLEDCGLEPAKTYSELKAQVPILKEKGYETVIMANKDGWVMQSCLFSAIAGRFCGEAWEQKILDGRTKFTDDDFVAALDFIRQLYADGVLASSSLGMDYGDSPGLFAANRGAYLIDGDWRGGNFLTDPHTGMALISPERQKKIRVTVFPDIEGAKLNRSTSTTLGTGWAISASIPEGSAREDAAWRLIKWLTGPEAQTRSFANGGLPTPSRVDLDYSGLNVEPLTLAIANLGKEYDTGTVVIDGVFHSDVFNPLNDGLQEIGLGTKTPQQAAADIQKAFDAARAAGKF